MKIPVIRGLIDRRILVNYRVDPAVLAPLLPAPFRPKLVRGVGMVGICLIRLKELRPRFAPAWLGIRSENAAHRAAVVFDDHGALGEGVFVRRRDTDSRLNSLAGGRLFPGYHHHARFTVRETADHFHVALVSDDGDTAVSVTGHLAGGLPGGTVFKSLDECSQFFEAGRLGYSATAQPARFQGLELRCSQWNIEPLEVESVQSSYFENAALFPRGSIQFDSALLMRGIQHEWHGQPDLCCATGQTEAALQLTGAATRDALCS